MADLDVAISGFVVGDDLEIRRTVTDSPDAVETAWLTMKRHRRMADEDAALQKEITVIDAEGVGQVVAPGGEGGDAILRFDLTAEDTLALGTRLYVYDIQVQLEDEKIYTVEEGTFQLTDEVTKAQEPSG
jgi:hypothetical protein